MTWTVLFHDAFDTEFGNLKEDLQDELLAEFGPNLGRHTNMKELRFSWNGQVWRIAFAFDPQRQAILLVGGDKGGADQRRFYKRLINVADERYDKHLGILTQQSKESHHGKKTR